MCCVYLLFVGYLCLVWFVVLMLVDLIVGDGFTVVGCLFNSAGWGSCADLLLVC